MPVSVEEAEAALVEHYPRLVRLAYAALPAGQGRHQRTLAAHRLVQRALPKAAGEARGGAYGLLRQRVLAAAFAVEEQGRLREALDELRPPWALGLRMVPRPASAPAQEPALLRALAALSPEARAAHVLLTAEGLGEPEARTVLDAAGAHDPREAIREAGQLPVPRPGGPGTAEPGRPPASVEPDACVVQLRPTGLLRRRRRGRIAGVAVAVAAAGAVVAALTAGGGSPQSYTASGAPGTDPHALDPASLVRAPAGQWKATTRMDFSAWPARGDRVHDTALLGRALAVWASPGSQVDVSATPGTSRGAPGQAPQLLFAGDEDAATVVLFYDGSRLVRYAQPRHGAGRAALDFAQAGDADAATSSAVLVDRVDGNARFLTAPWVTGARTRDLLRPDQAAAPLSRSADGVTGPVPMPGASEVASGSAACGSTWPAMQLGTSSRIPGGGATLLTDLGDLVPVRLAYSSPNSAGPTSSAGGATGSRALESWAHSACRLGQLRGQGMKSVDDWEFARTQLPGEAGEASWTCARADTWRGPGVAFVQFVPPGLKAGALGTLAGQQVNGNACSAYDPHVMAGVMWKAPDATWYVLAAASKGTTDLTAVNGVNASVRGAFLAAPASRGTRATLSGHLADGTPLSPLSDD
ncbi:hypothetical protein [Actinacidiphila yeochonensis]|uniref:hypothetical protein n=1 Tax=Actinacidiphila yeochonensis TaxID=89050 RepID=UPI00068F2F13|nr:hypothetical protein [Actinacidiphila yeochonensis]